MNALRTTQTIRFVGICVLIGLLGCSRGYDDVVPDSSIKRLSAVEADIDLSIFSDTTRVLYGVTTGDRVVLSREIRLAIKKTLEEAKFAQLKRSWKLPVKAMLITDDSKPEQRFLLLEGGVIEAGRNQYYVGDSWGRIVQRISNGK